MVIRPVGTAAQRRRPHHALSLCPTSRASPATIAMCPSPASGSASESSARVEASGDASHDRPDHLGVALDSVIDAEARDLVADLLERDDDRASPNEAP
jgi:hypothetical protein